MKLITTNQKKEGNFLITAFFNGKTNRPNRIDIERKVSFTLDDKQVEENAILRFKDSHKKGEIYTSEVIFANLTVERASYASGFGFFPCNKYNPFPSSKYRINPTLKTIWENPLKNRDIVNFMKLFDNFNLFIKEDSIVSPEVSSLKYFAKEIYKTYKETNENKKVDLIAYMSQINYTESLNMLNKFFER